MYIDSVGTADSDSAAKTCPLPPHTGIQPNRWSEEDEKFVVSATKRVRSHFPLEGEDLLQEARCAVVRAYSRFKPDKGASFRTFACYRIRGAITSYLRRKRRQQCDASIFEEIPVGRTNGNCLLIDTIIGEYPPDDRELRADCAAVRPLLRPALAMLPSKQAAVINDLFFKQASLAEVATKLGCTKQRVCAIRSDALSRLSTHFKRVVKFPLAKLEPAPAAL